MAAFNEWEGTNAVLYFVCLPGGQLKATAVGQLAVPPTLAFFAKWCGPRWRTICGTDHYCLCFHGDLQLLAWVEQSIPQSGTPHCHRLWT
jgi:hypothetical protein